jgi:hypothetical protein
MTGNVMALRPTTGISVAVELSSSDMAPPNKFVALNQGSRNSHGSTSIDKLATMLLEDVAAAMRDNSNPSASRIVVNNLGAIYRLDGGLVQVTFVQRYREPNLSAVEQASLPIWPEAQWHAYGDTMR